MNKIYILDSLGTPSQAIGRFNQRPAVCFVHSLFSMLAITDSLNFENRRFLNYVLTTAV